MSNWVGFACSYAPYGAMQWRLPLGLQIPFGIIMFAGLATFMPSSPRQLIRAGKAEQARMAFERIHHKGDEVDVSSEFMRMKAQIEFEMERGVMSYGEIWRLFRHRVLV